MGPFKHQLPITLSSMGPGPKGKENFGQYVIPIHIPHTAGPTFLRELTQAARSQGTKLNLMVCTYCKLRVYQLTQGGREEQFGSEAEQCVSEPKWTCPMTRWEGAGVLRVLRVKDEGRHDEWEH